MVARAYSVAFQGVEARMVEVQCAVTPGLPAWHVRGSAPLLITAALRRVCGRGPPPPPSSAAALFLAPPPARRPIGSLVPPTYSRAGVDRPRLAADPRHPMS